MKKSINVPTNTNASEHRILARGLYADTDGYKTRMNSNVAIIGSAGSGKTTGIVEPNLAVCRNSFIVTDTKGLLARRWRRNLEQRGYEVRVLDFVTFNQCGYDPIRYIRKAKDPKTGKFIYNELDISRITDFLVEPSKSKEPFWERGAAQELACMISYVLENMPEEYHNLATVTDVLRLAKVVNNSQIPFLEEYAYLAPDSLCARSYMNMAKTFMADRTWASVDSIASASVARFEARNIREMLMKKLDFRFRDLGRKKMAVFFNVSDIDHTFDRLIDLAYTQAILDLTSYADSMPDGRLPVETTLWFDDFGASCVIPDFPRWISVLRSRRISSVICLQSFTQLKTNYTDAEASTILSNCDRLIYLGSNDHATQTLIGQLGNLMSDKVQTLNNDQAIYIERGAKNARYVDKIMPDEYTPNRIPEGILSDLYADDEPQPDKL